MQTTPQPSCADPNEPDTLRADVALERILGAVRPLTGYEWVPLHEALNRVLHNAIDSPINVPAHTNSAVDGFAVRGDDLPAPGGTIELRITGTVLAGQPAAGRPDRGEAFRIMTGAPMPEGTDTVLMQEQVEELNGSIRVGDRHRRGDNVRMAGEDMQAGETVLAAGRLCTPADIGLLASLGLCEVAVRRRPRIAILSTGDELHDIGEPKRSGRVYDSNRYTLAAALNRLGIDVEDFGIVADDRAALAEALTTAATRCDAILSSGGVSVGQADHTRAVLAETGTVQFWKVAIKPGRPLAFGRVRDAAFFGLPGNPVAAMVTFYRFVLPALEKIMGITDKPIAPTLAAVSTVAIRKKAGRTEIQRGVLERDGDNHRWTVRTTGRQGSGILRSMSLANAFIILPHDSGPVEPGDSVIVQPFAGLI